MLRTSPRRITYLTALGVVIGLLSGGAAWVLIKFIALLTNVSLFGRVGWTLPSMTELSPSPRIVIVAMIGGLIVAFMARWNPIIKGHGIPEAMESIIKGQSRVAPSTAIAKPVSAAVAIGTGGPFGAEGPIIVTGGSLGSLIGQVLRVSPSERKILLACGAAGGMAATFGAPIAAIVLAIELLLFEFSTRAFIPVAVSSSVAGGVHQAVFGAGALFTVPHHDFAGLGQLPFYVPLGILCGLFAVLVARGLFKVEEWFRRLPVTEFWHPMIGALGFGLIGLAVPEVLGVGYDMIDLVLAGTLATGFLAILAGAKLVAWWLALGSGTSGGTLAPILLMAGAFGELIGRLTLQIWPDSGVSAGAFALVAMAATFGAATRATLTSIVFVFELTRDYEAILPLILASVLADLIGAWLLPHTIMTEKLGRRGLRVGGDLEVDPLVVTTVADVMTSSVVTVDSSSRVLDVIEMMAEVGHTAFPVVDETGEVVATISRDDVMASNIDSGRPVIDVAKTDVISISSSDTVRDASHLMTSEGVEHLPVLDGGRLVGMCTRTDVLKAYDRQVHESLQPGWLRPRRPRTD